MRSEVTDGVPFVLACVLASAAPALAQNEADFVEDVLVRYAIASK